MAAKPKKTAKRSGANGAGPNAASTAGAQAKSEKPKQLKGKVYDKELRRLQRELVLMQEWVKATGEKLAVVFEGRDAAGKGGVIKRIAERTNPRIAKVVALGTPTER